MAKVLVRWNKANVISVSTGLPDASVIQFIPGPNEIPAEKWKLIKDHPEFKKRMEAEVVDPIRGKVKMMELIAEKKPSSDQDQDQDSDGDQGEGSALSALGAKEAKELVAETFNTVLLKEWQTTETRGTVLKAVEKQLDAISKEREGESEDSQE